MCLLVVVVVVVRVFVLRALVVVVCLSFCAVVVFGLVVWLVVMSTLIIDAFCTSS